MFKWCQTVAACHLCLPLKLIAEVPLNLIEHPDTQNFMRISNLPHSMQFSIFCLFSAFQQPALQLVGCSLLPPWTQNTLLELILQLGLKYTEFCIHCQFILVIINSKMCALWQLFIYICLRFMPVSAATEVKHILFNISGPHCFGWFAQLTTGMFYSLVSLHCRLAVDIRFLIFEYCGNRIFFCYHI